MTDKTEAQPEALRLAAEFEDCIRIDAIPSINDVKESAAELRRQHAEIQQLRPSYQRGRLRRMGNGSAVMSICLTTQALRMLTQHIATAGMTAIGPLLHHLSGSRGAGVKPAGPTRYPTCALSCAPIAATSDAPKPPTTTTPAPKAMRQGSLVRAGRM